jgi:predicted membrane protein
MIVRKIILWVFIVLLVAFAAVQYNDIDGWLWILIYLLTAFMCFRASKRRGDKLSYLTIATLFLLWGINIYPPEWEGVMLNTAGMKTLNIELGRESLGLFICAFTMLFCGVWD